MSQGSVTLRGRFHPGGDKSISHRIALFSLLAEGICTVKGPSRAGDVMTTVEAVRSLGGHLEEDKGGWRIEGLGGRTLNRPFIWCGNSGTTMRLLMGILSGRPGTCVLDGDASLRGRPMERVARPLSRMGAEVVCTKGRPPVRVSGGPLRGMEYEMPVPSAQLKGAVLLAGIQAEGTTTLWEPVPSRDHTERLIRACGGCIESLPGGWRVGPSPLTMPKSFRVPGDVSSAAFLLCASAILPGSDVVAQQVSINPYRVGFIHVLRRMGARVEVDVLDQHPEPLGDVRVRYNPPLRACEVPPHEVPSLIDELPILALVATQAEGRSAFRGVNELRHKETDRLHAVCTQLGLMGARVWAEGDDLMVEGPCRFAPVRSLKSFGDHRIAMTLRIASLLTGIDPVIEQEHCVDISFPGFHNILKELTR